MRHRQWRPSSSARYSEALIGAFSALSARPRGEQPGALGKRVFQEAVDDKLLPPEPGRQTSRAHAPGIDVGTEG